MTAARSYFNGIRKFNLGALSDDLSQIGTVALTFLVVTQYWPIREHVVFILLFIYAVTVWVGSIRHASSDKPRLLALVFFLAFLLWLIVSTSWSPFLHMSVAYGLLSFLVGVSAVFQGLVLRLQNFARGIALGVAFQLAHSIFLWIPQFENPDANFVGLYTNVSSLSLVIGIGLAVLPFTLKRSWSSWLMVGVIFTGFAVYLVQLHVLTPFFALSGALLVGVMVGSLRRQGREAKKVLSALYLFVFAGGASIFWFFRGPILRLIGEDASMAERVPLWGLYFEAVLWRPVLGSGWGSTVGWDFPLSPDRLSPVAEWFPAHNGYLDIALMLGFVGLGLFLAALALLLTISLRDASERAVSVQVMVVPVLLVYLILNDLMATSFPKLLGIYLVGTLVGLVAARTKTNHDSLSSSAPS